MHAPRSLRRRWEGDGGYRQMLVIAFPLIISTGSWSIQHFVDRMFLTWHSPQSIAAVTPAGMLNFSILSLFIGTAGYVNTFVAQYHGAGREHRIGPALWQGLYVALFGGIAVLGFIPPAERIFALIGHDAGVQAGEVLYFRILCMGAVPVIVAYTLAGFFSGRGETRPVMWINIAGTLVNVVMDYLLIFGNGGFPELGIAGAGISTVASAVFTMTLYIVLILRRTNRDRFRTLAGWRFDSGLFGRLMRFGIPNGIQFFLEIAGYTVFIILVGRAGMAELAATNIAININSVAFLPMIGLGMAITVLVGRFLGEGRPAAAERSVWSGFHITFLYMGTIAALYVLFPDLFLAPYAARSGDADFETIRSMAVVLLRFVALYSLFDAMNIVFSYAIKGAGDTTFIMGVIAVSSVFVLVIPIYIALVIFSAHIYVGWAITALFIMVLGTTFLVRFLGGKWKTMRVIEPVPPPLPSSLPEGPAIEFKP